MQSPRLVAVDTNVLLSLAARDEVTLDALELIRQRLNPALILVPPTALEEVGHKALSAGDAELSRLASLSLREFRSVWHLQPAELRSDQEFIAENAATALRSAGLIPLAERNDAFILAEAAVLQCILLVSNDSHLLDVDRSGLRKLFDKLDLEPPTLASPRQLVRRFTR